MIPYHCRVTPQTIEANGLKFAYLEEGEGPLVLLVHGFPDTAHSWDATRPVLAEAGFRVVSPWTRGYLPTEIPTAEAYDADTLGADLLALIDALGHDNAVVVGHDWGASAAYSAAGLAPHKVRQLVTVAIPHPAGIVPTPRVVWNVRHFFSLRRKNAARWIRAGNLDHIDELVRRWSPTWNPSANETSDVKAAFEQPGCLEAALGYYRALSPKLPRGHRRPVTVPSVAFAGLDDLLPPEAFDRASKRYKASYEVVRMPGGHFMHREHPEHFNRELLRVLTA